MLITGFDAPILQTMYLDKPLKEHRLLQAVARTNRPCGDAKTMGRVVDYVGLLSRYKKALAYYSEDDLKGAISDFDDLREDFTSLIKELYDLFDVVPKDKYDRATMLKAIETVTANEENRKKFVSEYKKLRKIFELLGADEVKVKLLSEYKWLTAVYAYYISIVQGVHREELQYIERYFKKTLEAVYQATEVAE